jgi:replicative DNA helicase
MDSHYYSGKEVLNSAFNLMTVEDSYEENEEAHLQDFSQVAKATQNLIPGCSAIVLGSMPKPVLCAVAAYLAVERKARILVLCLKESPEHLIVEMLSYLSGIPKSKMFTYRIAPPYFPVFNDSCSLLYEAELSFCQLSGHNLQSLKDTLRSNRIAHRSEIVVVDELSLIGGVSASYSLLALSAELQSIARSDTVTAIAGCLLKVAESEPLKADEVIHSDGFRENKSA